MRGIVAYHAYGIVLTCRLSDVKCDLAVRDASIDGAADHVPTDAASKGRLSTLCAVGNSEHNMEEDLYMLQPQKAQHVQKHTVAKTTVFHFRARH